MDMSDAYIPDAWLADWDGAGKAGATTVLTESMAGKGHKVSHVLYELFFAAMHEKLSADAVTTLLTELECAEKIEGFASILGDIFWLTSCMADAAEDPGCAPCPCSCPAAHDAAICTPLPPPPFS
eukprot:COSAG05_NODE_177_length_14916_cov_8.104002_13_plen_125_part_00